MEDLPEAPPPESVRLVRESALHLRWPGETELSYSLVDLRQACPCAHCREARAAGRLVDVDDRAATTAADAELVGNWGLRITWSDGHDTGIYSWGLLHRWARDSSEPPQ